MNARHLFIQDGKTGRIRFTQVGIRKYRARFARVGYRVEEICTTVEFAVAVDAIFRFEMESLARSARGTDPELDRIMEGLPGWES